MEQEVDTEEVESGRCHDCTCLPGNFHHPGCDMEQCPRCGDQAITCDCLNRYVSEEAEKKAFTRDFLAKLLQTRDNQRVFQEMNIPRARILGTEALIQSVIEYVNHEFYGYGVNKEVKIEELLSGLGYFKWAEVQE